MRPKIIPDELSIKKPFFWGLAACIISFVCLGVFWASLPPQIPLFFSKPRGEAQLAPTLYLALPSIIALILLFVNSVFIQITQQSPLFKRMLILGATTACILSTITIVRILLLVL